VREKKRREEKIFPNPSFIKRGTGKPSNGTGKSLDTTEGE
jgi:hypothetical protein